MVLQFIMTQTGKDLLYFNSVIYFSSFYLHFTDTRSYLFGYNMRYIQIVLSVKSTVKIITIFVHKFLLFSVFFLSLDGILYVGEDVYLDISK